MTQYLKNQRLGRATFIPLDTIVAHPVNERFRNLAKGARLAIDLIKYESVYERAMQYACGSTIICDSLQIARHVIYDKNNQVKGQYKFTQVVDVCVHSADPVGTLSRDIGGNRNPQRR